MNSPDHADATIKGLQDAKIGAIFCYALWKNPPWKGSCVNREWEEESPDWRIKDARRIKEQHFQSNELGDLLRFGFVTLSQENPIRPRLINFVLKLKKQGL
jgi:hypothetical protein